MPALAITTALIIGAIIVWRSGENPLVAYSSLLAGAFGSRSGVGESIVYMTPLVLTGLSVAVAFRCGLFNIGAEGQYIVGMIAAAWAGYAFTGLPAFLHVPVTLLAGAAAGAVWAAIPGVLKAKLGVHEVINTIMMNHIAIYFTHYPVMDLPGASRLQPDDETHSRYSQVAAGVRNGTTARRDNCGYPCCRRCVLPLVEDDDRVSDTSRRSQPRGCQVRRNRSD